MKGNLEEFKKTVEKASIMELVLMQHELRRFKEDKDYLFVVLKEIEKRDKTKGGN